MIKRVVLFLFTGLTILSLSGCSREPKEYEAAAAEGLQKMLTSMDSF